MTTAAMAETRRKTRVLLIDENPLFLETTAGFLNRQEGMVALRTSASVEAALIGARDFNPAVIVLDPSALGTAGLGIVGRLRKKLPGVRVIVMALVDSPTYRDASIAAGADDFVAKTDIVSELLPAIHRVSPPALGQRRQ